MISICIHSLLLLRMFPFHMMNCAQWTTVGEYYVIVLCNCIMHVNPMYLHAVATHCSYVRM